MSRSGGNRWLCGKKVDWCLEMYGCCFGETEKFFRLLLVARTAVRVC